METEVNKLRVGNVFVELWSGFPGCKYYSAVENERKLPGMAEQKGFEVVVLDRENRIYKSTAIELKTDVHVDKVSDGRVDYRVRVVGEGVPVAEISVGFTNERNGACVTSTILDETAGWEVASVRLEMLRIPRSYPGASLAFGNRCGRLIDLKTASVETGTHIVDWYEPAALGIGYYDDLLGVLSLDSPDNQILHQVDDEAGSICVELVHRHRCQSPANSFLAHSRASCLLRFVSAPVGRKVDWTDGAAILRDDVEPHVHDLYSEAIVYKVMLQAAFGEMVTTYKDVWKMIEKVNSLTGGAKQIVYLVGWQHNGHDTGYPDVFTANSRVGSFEDFKALKNDAKSLNAIVSVHDNYHDTYMESPLWDPSIVCVNPDGELRKGGNWGAGQAYEIGPTKYVKDAVVRAERTVKMLDLEATTHLDVLSDKPNMVDFDPISPANRQQNADAKEKIVEAFRNLGVDVTSEVLTSPFVPFLHHFWHAVLAPDKSWRADDRIPLIPFIYHGKVTAGGDASTDVGKLDQIAYGLTFSVDWTKETTDKEILEAYYLVALPWMLFAKMEITGFERNGCWDTLQYGADNYVKVNRSQNEYQIVLNNQVIAENFSTFVGRSDNEFVVYSRHGRTVELPDRRQIGLEVLSGSTPPVVDGNRLIAEPGHAYRVLLEAMNP